ncbi:MAG: hypothetical protein AAF419_03790 [Pseudomonadota bacterium]
MPSQIKSEYRPHLLPKRLLFFDLDGTIIPSTKASGRRIAISLSTYEKVKAFAKEHLNLAGDLPELTEQQCSEWYKTHGGPKGLLRRVLQDTSYADDIKDNLTIYFNGLFTKRLTAYLKDDLKHDSVPEENLEFLLELSSIAHMVLVSYRYQTQFDFLNSVEDLGLSRNGVFGPNNAFAVGAPGTSSDGSKARFIGGMWRNEIRAQRRLTSEIGKTFPPICIGDSVRDIHFTVDIGGIFFGVSETGEDNQETLVTELKRLEKDISARSRIFDALCHSELKRRLLEECNDYRHAVQQLETA